MKANPANDFFDAWGSPAVDGGAECLPDSLLVGIAKGAVADQQSLAHIQGCQVCGSTVSVLRETLREPGKNLDSLIEQAKIDAEKVASRRAFRWTIPIPVRGVVPIAAAAVVLLAVLWDPLVKNFSSFKHNETNFAFGADQLAPVIQAVRVATNTVAAPNVSGDDRRAAILRANEILLAIDSTKLTTTQVEALNARISNLQSAYNRAVFLSAGPERAPSPLEGEVYTSYQQYKAASQGSGRHSAILFPVDPQQAVVSAARDIKITRDPTGAVMVEPLRTKEFEDPRWVELAMQGVAKRNGVFISVRSGEVVHSFAPHP